MDLFDTAILNLLRDGKPREFHEILATVKFSHNTLRSHLELLLDQRVVSRSKRPVEGVVGPDLPIWSPWVRVGLPLWFRIRRLGWFF